MRDIALDGGGLGTKSLADLSDGIFAFAQGSSDGDYLHAPFCQGKSDALPNTLSCACDKGDFARQR